MARSKDISTQKIGLEGRFAFAQNLFEPQKDRKTQQPKNYGCTVLFPKSADLTALKEIAFEAAKEEWGGKMDVAEALKSGLIKSPFLDGDGKQGKSKETGEPHEGFPGHTFIRVTSGLDYPPKVFISANGAIRPATKADVGSGDYGYIVINAYTWENQENGKGITFGLSMLMKSRTGESLGGAGGPSNPNEYFNAVPDEGSAPEETKGGDGAAALF